MVRSCSQPIERETHAYSSQPQIGAQGCTSKCTPTDSLLFVNTKAYGRWRASCLFGQHSTGAQVATACRLEDPGKTAPQAPLCPLLPTDVRHLAGPHWSPEEAKHSEIMCLAFQTALMSGLHRVLHAARYCPSGNEEWSTEPGLCPQTFRRFCQFPDEPQRLSEPPAPPPPGSLVGTLGSQATCSATALATKVQSAGFVVGLDEFDGSRLGTSGSRSVSQSWDVHLPLRGGESRSPVGVSLCQIA